MPKTSSSPLLFLVLVSFSFSLMSACQRSMNLTGGVKADVLESPAAVERSKENLSMAKELRDVPTTEYLLGPEDTVEISVFRHDELNLRATIGTKGKISFYLLGDLEVAGLTRFQLRDKIRKGLTRYIKDPQVVVKIVEYRSRKVMVLGEVGAPGMYHMRSSFTLLEAISAAGGVDDEAYLPGAYVVRDGKVLLVNFCELIEKGNTGEDIPLLPEDLIYIPDNRDQRVFVLGEVNNQKAVTLRENLNLLEAIVQAGGFTKDAKKDSVIIVRGNLSSPEIMKVNVEQPALGANIALRQGDIVYVATSSMAHVERIALRISHILQPFYNLARTVVWGDAAVGVSEGKDSRFVIE